MPTKPTNDEKLMRRALQLARRGEGWVEPNPMVGAVLARAGEILAEGHHRAFGQPHAERQAIADARQRGIDPATCDLYVTLEPCCHHGKTPPCVDAILEARIPRVFAAIVDPFDRVAGQGIAKLKEAGVEVHLGLCDTEARRLIAPFTTRITKGRPWVIAKWAQTLDGAIATRTGDSRWISSPASRRLVHRLRARVDAVLVGIGTALADDPLLTARDVRIRRRARRIVIDPRLELPLECRLIKSLNQGGPPLLIATHEHAITDQPDRASQLTDRSVELFALAPLPDQPTRLDFAPLFKHLAAHHSATNVLVEGGASLLGSLLGQKLIDEAHVFISPRLLGDADATHAITGFTRDRIAEADTLKLERTQRVGDDVLLQYRAAD